MIAPLSRRHLVRLLPLGIGSAMLTASRARGGLVPLGPHAPPQPNFPLTESSTAREVVGLAHGNLDRLRPLIEDRPALARAAFDWGFGDWETALGAASHMGRRDIAEFLLAHGARPDLFSAAMLGNFATVRTMIDAQPGLQRTHGPHGITLLAHARAGGDRAREVVSYLESFGGADERYRDEPISDEDRARIIGPYLFGSTARDQFFVDDGTDGLTIKRFEGVPRRLFHQGGLAFHPAGAPAARLRFYLENARVRCLEIWDGPSVIVASPGGC